MKETNIKTILETLEEGLEAKNNSAFKHEVLDYLKAEGSAWKKKADAGVGSKEFEVINKILQAVSNAETIVNKA